MADLEMTLPPPPAVKSLTDLNVDLFVPRGVKFIELDHITETKADQIIYDIKRFQEEILAFKESDRRSSNPIINNWVKVLERNQDPNAFVQQPLVKQVLEEIRKTGLMILDTECGDQFTLGKLGIAKANMATIDLIQIGSIFGRAVFIRAEFDCRDHHKCQCGKGCKDNTCPERVSSNHNIHQYINDYKNFGADIPQEFIDLLTDPYIYKFQSAIRCKGGDLGDLERLERLINKKIPSFVESQNIVMMYINGEKNPQPHPATGNNFVSKYFKMPVNPLDCSWIKNMWSTKRRVPFYKWTNHTILYDINDIQCLSVMLLNLGKDIVKREKGAGPRANLMGYIRMVMQIYLNEPNIPNGNNLTHSLCQWPHEEWTMEEQGFEAALHDKNWPWRVGLRTGELDKDGNLSFNIPGPIVSRNLRQLVTLMTGDKYYVPYAPGMIDKHLSPEDKNPILQAREVWRNEPSRKIPPFETKIRDRHGSIDQFGTRNRLTKCKTLMSEEERQTVYDSTSSKSVANLTPSSKIKNYTNSKAVLYGICCRCGSNDHIAIKCPKTDAELRCSYPLCPSKAGHVIRTCQWINRICRGCTRRGHGVEAHAEFDVLTLQLLFEAWACQGHYTSLVYIDQDPGHWRRVTDQEHRFSHYVKCKSVGLAQKYSCKHPGTPAPTKPIVSMEDIRERERRAQRGEQDRKRDQNKRPYERSRSRIYRDRSHDRETKRSSSRNRNRDHEPRPSTSRMAENPLYHHRSDRSDHRRSRSRDRSSSKQESERHRRRSRSKDRSSKRARSTEKASRYYRK